MNKFFITLIALAIVHTSFSQTQKNLASQIEDVTVFMRGAEIHHTATEKLSEGKNSITFTGLSPDMNPESVVMEVEPKNLTILSVSTRSNYLNPVADNKRIAQVRDSLNIVNDHVSTLQSQIDVLNAEKQMLFKNEAIGGTANNVPIAEIEKAADFYRNRMNNINTQLFSLNKKLNEEKFLQTQYQKQLTELNAQFNPPTSEITLVVLSNEKSVNANFSFKYLVLKAGWAPKYDVRAENVDSKVQLIYRANVFNDSGIDWMDVKMKLSTADPLQGAEKPTLETWDVADIKRMPSLNAAVEMVVINDQKSDYFKKEENKAGEEVGFQQIAVAELSAEFNIPLPYTILADSKPYTVDVTEYSLDAKYEHYAAPKMDVDAFLTAKITGWNDLNLVSGKASVYFAGTYLGQSIINTASVEDTLSISLGRDKKVALKRDKLVELNKRQIIGNNEKETFFFETTMRNNRDRVIVVELVDQVPISSEGDIVVDALETSGGVVDEPTGKITWRIALNPGETKKVTLGYSIKSPKGRKVYTSLRRVVSCPSF